MISSSNADNLDPLHLYLGDLWHANPAETSHRRYDKGGVNYNGEHRVSQWLCRNCIYRLGAILRPFGPV